MNTKTTPGSIKDASAKDGIVVGYASTFGNVDQVGDIVAPGAFNRTLASRRAKIKALYQHSPFDPVGKPIEIRTDDVGLLTETQFSDTAVGRDTLKLIEDGVITDLSIGYDPLDFAWDEDGHLILKEVKLYEYSFVTFPANESAVVLGVKSETRDTMIEQMKRLERSLARGDWQSDDFAEALALQLKAWQALITAPPSPEDEKQLDGPAPELAHALRDIRDTITLTRLAATLR